MTAVFSHAVALPVDAETAFWHLLDPANGLSEHYVKLVDRPVG